jgi:hypothetical protein
MRGVLLAEGGAAARSAAVNRSLTALSTGAEPARATLGVPPKTRGRGAAARPLSDHLEIAHLMARTKIALALLTVRSCAATGAWSWNAKIAASPLCCTPPGRSIHAASPRVPRRSEMTDEQIPQVSS